MGQKKGEFRYSIRDEVPGQAVLDFLHNAGSYRRVRTQKVDFLTFPDFDYSRTRLLDDGWGYEWDRVVVYLKNPEIFTVFDVFKARREDWFTLADLWHTQKVTARGEHWYKTAYETIQDKPLPAAKDLFLLFLPTQFTLEGVEPIKRHYQDEFMVHQTIAQHFELGETVGFVSVLIPHSRQTADLDWPDRVRLLPTGIKGEGTGLTIETPESTYFIGIKNDLRKDISRDWRRPRYTYEAGKIRLGEFETDGDFLFSTLTSHPGTPAAEKLSYTIVNLTKALFRQGVLFEAKPSNFGLAFDGRPDGPGVGKLRYWREKTDFKKVP